MKLCSRRKFHPEVINPKDPPGNIAQQLFLAVVLWLTCPVCGGEGLTGAHRWCLVVRLLGPHQGVVSKLKVPEDQWNGGGAPNGGALRCAEIVLPTWIAPTMVFGVPPGPLSAPRVPPCPIYPQYSGGTQHSNYYPTLKLPRHQPLCHAVSWERQ